MSSGVENEIVSVWVKNESESKILPKYQYFSVFQPNFVSTKCEDVDECLRNRTIFKKFAGIRNIFFNTSYFYDYSVFFGILPRVGRIVSV